MGKPRPPTQLPTIGTLTEHEIAFLLAGRNRGARWRPGAYTDAGEAWDRHRDELIRFWTHRRRDYPLRMRGSPVLHVPGPGHMPFWWWHTEAPEPRRILTEDGTREIWTLAWAKGLRRDWDGRGRGRFAFGLPVHHPPGVEFESEAEYLARLGLNRPGGDQRNRQHEAA